MASITKRGKKYRALVRMKGVSKCKTFQTKSAARTWATRIEAELDQASTGSRLPLKGWAMASLIDRYIEDVKENKHWGAGKDSAFNVLKRHLGERPATSFGVDMLLSYANVRRREGVTDSTIASDISYLSSVVKYARNSLRLDLPEDAIKEARNALADSGLLSMSEERDRRPTEGELALLHAYFDRSWSKIPMADIIDFAIHSGMRRGEIARILWDDLDTEKRTVLIRDRKHPQKKLGNHQTVPLLNESFDIVMRQKRTDDPRIFPFSAQVISDTFIRACKSKGVKDLRLHDLRHHALSILFEQGYQIQEVALISGHRSWDMLRRYTNIKPESLHR